MAKFRKARALYEKLARKLIAKGSRGNSSLILDLRGFDQIRIDDYSSFLDREWDSLFRGRLSEGVRPVVSVSPVETNSSNSFMIFLPGRIAVANCHALGLGPYVGLDVDRMWEDVGDLSTQEFEARRQEVHAAYDAALRKHDIVPDQAILWGAGQSFNPQNGLVQAVARAVL
jgi:hypothetical protein